MNFRIDSARVPDLISDKFDLTNEAVSHCSLLVPCVETLANGALFGC